MKSTLPATVVYDTVRIFRDILQLRESFAVLFLAVWLCMMFKPFSPILSDAFQHTFNSKNHHALLHIYNVNHVDDEVSNIVKDETEKQQNNSANFSIENPFTFFVETSSLNFFEDVHLLVYRFDECKIRTRINAIQSPPPEV
ncbi:MAG: hypothetical protein H7Y00_10045 [Fimbriimonadaceae bacterium]|nr:hypothetical protein [Chitinophagales bacterium]